MGTPGRLDLWSQQQLWWSRFGASGIGPCSGGNLGWGSGSSAGAGVGKNVGWRSGDNGMVRDQAADWVHGQVSAQVGDWATGSGCTGVHVPP